MSRSRPVLGQFLEERHHVHFKPVVTLLVLLVCGLLAILVCTACGEALETVGLKDKVVVNDFRVLGDGDQHSYRLESGSYKVEVTATNDGAAIEWVGCSCPKMGQSNNISTTCHLTQTGQLIVSNPTTFGLGKSTSVTVKVTKL